LAAIGYIGNAVDGDAVGEALQPLGDVDDAMDTYLVAAQ
jgi:hypothetical protein